MSSLSRPSHSCQVVQHPHTPRLTLESRWSLTMCHVTSLIGVVVVAVLSCDVCAHGHRWIWWKHMHTNTESSEESRQHYLIVITKKGSKNIKLGPAWGQKKEKKRGCKKKETSQWQFPGENCQIFMTENNQVSSLTFHNNSLHIIKNT